VAAFLRMSLDTRGAPATQLKDYMVNENYWAAKSLVSLMPSVD